ncbi:type I-E CRISPR-associated protein Cas7/Cse4/CasC [Tessaracoccus defluvii]|uniref:Type I-E CRISPR-associated protein Cas7/Cse4/CasC n=1 Tax=Tessaracoccus defluvii TaxID=1285901 RepID=A0A7H0H2F4_9ACTN|nr:type I-E CRISPR-associated protein Cas7/Cse4/CasC [Tessaracoccus defluvii]QNP54720.1 type I-E CRISPR-associated protein Cas7/Cse4/CasC [Tessaracoccus defluvii]
MTTYLEIHAIQSVPPANLNRDDTGSPKSAIYGGVTRARVSSQSWKRAMRTDFNNHLDPKDVGTRSRMLVTSIEKMIVEAREDLAPQAQELAVAAMEAAGFKKPVPRKTGKDTAGAPETGYLVFLSQRQLESLAAAAIEASGEDNPLNAMKAAKVKDLVDADHSVDIALFGRMVADAADLNVDAACQVAHAISVHEAIPEFDFFTAVDDAKSRNADEEDAGAGMMGTVGFVSSTLYRYAAVNLDQLRANLGDEEAARLALEAFVRSFVNSMPSGKQNTFANGTRPAAVLVTVASGQPSSLVGAFEKPIRSSDGYVARAVEALAKHASEVFGTWRQPSSVWVTGTPSELGALADLGDLRSFDELVEAAGSSVLESV